MLVVREGGERSMVSDRGANALLSPSDLPDRLMAKGLLVSAYVLFDPDSEAAGRTALERAEAEFIAVDAASWPLLKRFGRNRFLDATRRVDVLLVNQREAEALAPGGREALTEHYRHVFLKLGSSGASYGTGDRWVSLPAPRVIESRDTTGAGDAFVGVLLAQLARGAAPEAALEQACVAGAEVVRTGQSWPAAVS
jgi:sugar/nucleoside kinase (ribokinase family)